MTSVYVEIKPSEKRIGVWFGYDTDLVLRIKAIPGRSFIKTPAAHWATSVESKHWTVPLTYQTCLDLRRAFGKQLVIGPGLGAWAAVERERTQVGAALGVVSAEHFYNATLDRLPAECPGLYQRLLGRPYQIPAAKFVATLPATLVADQPGLGKTVEILGGIVEAYADAPSVDVIAIVPKTSIRTVWVPETVQWLETLRGKALVFAATGSALQREKTIARFLDIRSRASRPKLMMLVTNGEMLMTKYEGPDDDDKRGRYIPKFPQLFSIQWDVQIVDEGHKYLITRSGQPWNKKMTQWRRGLAKLPLKPDGKRIAASGTPWKGKALNLWGTLNWLDPIGHSSFWTFADSYLEVMEEEYGKSIGDVRPARLEALYRMLDRYMIRRTKPELRKINPAWAPPDKQYVTVRCEMDPKQEKQYRAMERDAAVTLGDETLTANGILAEMTRLKQFAHCCGTMETGVFKPSLPSGKFDMIVQMLEERGITGDKDDKPTTKVVIGSQFTSMINLYAAALVAMGINVLVLTGETSDPKRERYVAEFMKPGGPSVFLINTWAGGVSITLDVADELWILDETWVPDEQEQLEDRVHRTSNTEHQVTISYFITLGTIEEDISATTASKDETQKQHLDGRRGVAFAKQWIAKVAA